MLALKQQQAELHSTHHQRVRVGVGQLLQLAPHSGQLILWVCVGVWGQVGEAVCG